MRGVMVWRKEMETMWEVDGVHVEKEWDGKGEEDRVPTLDESGQRHEQDDKVLAAAPMWIAGNHREYVGSDFRGSDHDEGVWDDDDELIFGFSPVSECALTDYMSRIDQVVDVDEDQVEEEMGWGASAPIAVRYKGQHARQEAEETDELYGTSLFSNASPMSECGLTNVMSRAHLNDETSDSGPLPSTGKEEPALEVCSGVGLLSAARIDQHVVPGGTVFSECSTVSTLPATPANLLKKPKSSSLTPSSRKRTDANNHSGAGGKYEYRKKMAISRPRVNGRFIKIADKAAVREAMELK